MKFVISVDKMPDTQENINIGDNIGEIDYCMKHDERIQVLFTYLIRKLTILVFSFE